MAVPEIIDGPNIYIIGGASRSGKTLLSRKLAESTGVSVFSADWLGKPLRIARSGVAEPTKAQNKKLEAEKDLLEVARNDWEIIQALIDNVALHGVNYCFEGEHLLPELVHGLQTYLNNQRQIRIKRDPEEIRYGKIAVRSCFLGYADTDVDQKLQQVRKYHDAPEPYDWTAGSEHTELRDMVTKRVEHSKVIRAQANSYGLPYIDTGGDFNAALENALKILVD